MRGQVACASTTRPGPFGVADPGGPAGLPGGGHRDPDADWVVLGPGSWFTSVLPHLMVPELAQALISTPGPADRGPEPGRRSPARPTGSRRRPTWKCWPMHAPQLRIDVVLADRGAAAGQRPPSWRRRRACWAAGWCWPTWPWRDGTPRHDPRQAGRGVRRDFRGGVRPMAMTGLVKDELSRVTVLKPCCRKAEVSDTAAVRRADCTWPAAASWWRPSSTPAWPPGGCARTSPRCSAIPRT